MIELKTRPDTWMSRSPGLHATAPEHRSVNYRLLTFALPILVVEVVVAAGAETPARPCASRVLGREWQAESPRFTVFANDGKGAERLREWVKGELDAFCQDKNCNALGKGIIFAIESDKDPSESVQEWAERHVSRLRNLNWSSSIKLQSFQTQNGRPYCLGDLPYFRESFCFPPGSTKNSFEPKTPLSDADWICFLTLDEYFSLSFENELKRLRSLYEAELKKVPLEVRQASQVALAIMEMVAPLVYAKQKSIDLELLQLQRREVLRATWLSILHSRTSGLQKHLAELQDEIDQQWQFIWFRRPLD